jgi:hypothetical protein
VHSAGIILSALAWQSALVFSCLVSVNLSILVDGIFFYSNTAAYKRQQEELQLCHPKDSQDSDGFKDVHRCRPRDASIF